MAKPTRRTVINAFGKYLTYAEALADIKRGEREGDVGEFARAVKYLERDYMEKMDAFCGNP